MIDMSDLEDLDEISIDLEETSRHTEAQGSEQDTVIMARPAVPLAERSSDSESVDITFDLSDAATDETPTPSAAHETIAASAADDLLEAELELDLEAGEEQRPAEPEADLTIDLDAFDLSDDDADDRPQKS
jgi:hypothetical protein